MSWLVYFGEANVDQENLDSFLAVAEELKLEGLAGQSSHDLLEKQENPQIQNLLKRTENYLR